MRIENDISFSIILESDFHEDIITEQELVLIQSILPEVLEEIIAQAEANKE